MDFLHYLIGWSVRDRSGTVHRISVPGRNIALLAVVQFHASASLKTLIKCYKNQFICNRYEIE